MARTQPPSPAPFPPSRGGADIRDRTVGELREGANARHFQDEALGLGLEESRDDKEPSEKVLPADNEEAAEHLKRLVLGHAIDAKVARILPQPAHNARPGWMVAEDAHDHGGTAHEGDSEEDNLDA